MGIIAPTIEELVKADPHHRTCPERHTICAKMVAVADLPSRFGKFKVVAFYSNKDNKEHAAFVHGEVCSKEDVPVRIHSECLTGDAIGSLRCDCREQLERSLEAIGSIERGVLLYLRQEGRGIGLANKIKAYQLQDHGFDTYEANEILGFKPDERDYEIAAHMLRSLNIHSVQLMTNNPNKIEQLQTYGVHVNGRIPLMTEPNRFNRKYLETKKVKAGHLLDELFRDPFEQNERPMTYRTPRKSTSKKQRTASLSREH